MPLPEQLDDRPIQGLTFVLVSLPDMDSHQNPLALETVHAASFLLRSLLFRGALRKISVSAHE
jgi:hypothetical protein